MRIEVRVEGPFFRVGAVPIERAIENTVREIAAEGETDVKMQLYPGHGLVTGHYRRSIHGEVLNSRNGLVHDSRVVYGPWLEGVSSRNQTSRFKGYAMFRNTLQGLQRKAPAILTKHIGRAIRELN